MKCGTCKMVQRHIRYVGKKLVRAHCGLNNMSLNRVPRSKPPQFRSERGKCPLKGIKKAHRRTEE